MHKMDEMVAWPSPRARFLGECKGCQILAGADRWPKTLAEADVQRLPPCSAMASTPRPNVCGNRCPNACGSRSWSGPRARFAETFWRHRSPLRHTRLRLPRTSHPHTAAGAAGRPSTTQPSPTQRRARQDGPPQRNLPPTFHNAIFRTVYLSSS